MYIEKVKSLQTLHVKKYLTVLQQERHKLLIGRDVKCIQPSLRIHAYSEQYNF